jgi:hypothetical protein
MWVYANFRIGARVPLAGRLLFLLCTLSPAAFARAIDIPVNIFGGGVSFDQIDLFDETAGTHFDTGTSAGFDPAGGFAQWSFNYDTETYAVGYGPDTIGAPLTLSVSGTTSSGLNDSVTIRVYLLSGGKIVAAFDVTFTDSGFIVVPVSMDPSALQLSQQQALTLTGTTPAGQQAGGGYTTIDGGTDPGGGGADPSGGGNTTPTNDNVPEPGLAGPIAAALIGLAGLRRSAPVA